LERKREEGMRCRHRRVRTAQKSRSCAQIKREPGTRRGNAVFIKKDCIELCEGGKKKTAMEKGIGHGRKKGPFDAERKERKERGCLDLQVWGRGEDH